VKQQCHISMIYLSWAVYVGGLMVVLWRGYLLFALIWLVAAPLCQWIYVRHFPRFSAALGYGPIADEAAGESTGKAADVVLYTALGCPFCPLIEQRLENLRAQLGFSLRKVDVTLRPDLLTAKGIRSVPAVEIGGQFLTGLATTQALAAAITGQKNS